MFQLFSSEQSPPPSSPQARLSNRPSIENNKNGLTGVCEAVFCAPSGARTLDPNIKSVVLYQLS